MKMEFPFEILRGWPNGSAVDSVEKVNAAAVGASALAAGDVVQLQPDGSINKSGAAASNQVGFVVRGNGDSRSAVAAGNLATVIWSGFIARTQKYNTAAAISVNSPVTAKNGVIDLAAGTDPVIGFVKEVVAASGSEPANIVIVVR